MNTPQTFTDADTIRLIADNPHFISTQSRLADPMRANCANLTETIVKSGHWMAQEKPLDVNAALAKWLAAQFPALWPPA